MYYTWIKEKDIKENERQRRRIIFYNTIGIMYNTGPVQQNL